MIVRLKVNTKEIDYFQLNHDLDQFVRKKLNFKAFMFIYLAFICHDSVSFNL
jgi:hypothetical protein